MRKVVVATSISLDGFMGGPNGELDWARIDPHGEHSQDALELLRETGTIIVGSTTAAAMAAHWPFSDEPLAEPMNSTPKLVFSRSGATIEWSNVEVTAGDLREELEKLKAEGEGHIVAYGGSRFLQSLTREGLVDEYRLTIHPILLGEGIPVFPQGDQRRRLELVEAKQLAEGSSTHRYHAVSGG